MLTETVNTKFHSNIQYFRFNQMKCKPEKGKDRGCIEWSKPSRRIAEHNIKKRLIFCFLSIPSQKHFTNWLLQIINGLEKKHLSDYLWNEISFTKCSHLMAGQCRQRYVRTHMICQHTLVAARLSTWCVVEPDNNIVPSYLEVYKKFGEVISTSAANDDMIIRW